MARSRARGQTWSWSPGRAGRIWIAGELTHPLWSGWAAELLALGRDQAVAADREDLGLGADQDLGHVARVRQPRDEHPRLGPPRPFVVQLNPYAHLRMVSS